MLERCVRSVRDGLKSTDELIVVDSASNDSRSVARIASQQGARLVRCDRPGASRARNAGWQIAKHDIIVFVDDDVWVDSKWAGTLASRLDSDPMTAFVTGRILVPDGQRVALTVAEKKEENPALFELRSRGPFGHSASLAVRRSALKEVGGFDEEMGAGARFHGEEDGDLFDRLLQRGYLGRFEPGALAWHDQWRTKSELVGLHWGYGVGAGARVAKLLRTDLTRAKRVALEHVWDWGIKDMWNAIHTRQKFLVATTASRMLGMLVGAARGLGTSLALEHYSSPDNEGAEPLRSDVSDGYDQAGVGL